MMYKNFDQWNKVKQKIHTRESKVFAYAREVWWCSLGINIGFEIDGKHDNFERPVIVVKVYNKESMLVLPLTTKEKNDKFHHRIFLHQKTVWVKLTQPRMISNKRLVRKIGTLENDSFQRLKEIWKKSL